MTAVRDTNLELFVLHFNGKPLHLVTNRFGEWRPTKKIYFTESAAKCGLKYVPEKIRQDCEIVKYVPENG